MRLTDPFSLPCSAAASSPSQAQDTLLLFHPTAYNLELIESLDEQGILDLEGYHILGVYHSGEAYDFDSASLKVSENPGWALLAN